MFVTLLSSIDEDDSLEEISSLEEEDSKDDSEEIVWEEDSSAFDETGIEELFSPHEAKTNIADNIAIAPILFFIKSPFSVN